MGYYYATLRLVGVTTTMIPVEPKDKIHHGSKTKTPPLLILPLLLGWL